MLEYPTQERLKELLSYNRRTGLFRWKVAKAACVRRGDIAGNPSPGRYTKIQIDGISYQAHLLAWIYVRGVRPAQIDHRDLEPSNNRWPNLRPASGTQNQANKPKSPGRSSQFKGVTWHKGARKWQSSIKAEGRSYYLGLFDSEGAAHAAYVAKAEILFGTFARAA